GKLDSNGGGSKVYGLAELNARQHGPYIAVSTADSKSRSGSPQWTLELRDYLRKNTVWSRRFSRGYPETTWDMPAGRVLLWWSTWVAAAKDELKQTPELRAKAEDDDYFFEVVDFGKDAVVNRLLVKTNKGSYRILSASFEGDWLAVTTKDDRVLTYSLGGGEQTGHIFGHWPAISSPGECFVVSASERILDVYDLPSTELRNRYKFSTPVIYRRFSPDGKRLFVLTNDQTAYVLDLAVALEGSNSASEAHP